MSTPCHTFSLCKSTNKTGGCSPQLALASLFFASDWAVTEPANLIPRTELLIPRYELLIPSSVTGTLQCLKEFLFKKLEGYLSHCTSTAMYEQCYTQALVQNIGLRGAKLVFLTRFKQLSSTWVWPRFKLPTPWGGCVYSLNARL